MLRLDYATKAPLGFGVRCGKYANPTAEEARSEAVSATGFGAKSQQIAGDNPQDIFLFYAPPADIGDVAAVSRRSGLALFGGSIIGLGKGDITFPTEWRSPAEIGPSCEKPWDKPISARGFDLRDGKGLDAGEVDAVMAVASATALPEAMYKNNYLFDATVLLYPRSMLGFDPSSAEWIVLLHGGWLELAWIKEGLFDSACRVR